MKRRPGSYEELLRKGKIMNFVRINGCVIALLLFSYDISVAAVFQPNDRIVSDPAQSIRDPEFDPTYNLMVWQDELNQLWLADLDPATGEISPFNGKGQLIDSELSNLILIGNGPEFGYGNGETILCYNKTISSTRILATASKDESDNWVPVLEDQGDNRYRPICSPEGTLDPVRMIYVQDVSPGESVVSWRVVGDPDSERSFRQYQVSVDAGPPRSGQLYLLFRSTAYGSFSGLTLTSRPQSRLPSTPTPNSMPLPGMRQSSMMC